MELFWSLGFTRWGREFWEIEVEGWELGMGWGSELFICGRQALFGV